MVEAPDPVKMGKKKGDSQGPKQGEVLYFQRRIEAQPAGRGESTVREQKTGAQPSRAPVRI